MSTSVLPHLPCDHGAIEPRISARIMELHHGKHPAACVGSANEVIESLDRVRAKEVPTRLAALEKALAFNPSGHILRSIVRRSITKQRSGNADGPLGEAIRRDPGSYRLFRNQMNEVAATIAEFFDALWSAWNRSDIGQRSTAARMPELRARGGSR